eukprot:12467658-Alexandrium_andersonii.AAC.1
MPALQAATGVQLGGEPEGPASRCRNSRAAFVPSKSPSVARRAKVFVTARAKGASKAGNMSSISSEKARMTQPEGTS